MSVDDIFLFIHIIQSPHCVYQLDEKVHIWIDFGQASNKKNDRVYQSAIIIIIIIIVMPIKS